METQAAGSSGNTRTRDGSLRRVRGHRRLLAILGAGLTGLLLAGTAAGVGTSTPAGVTRSAVAAPAAATSTPAAPAGKSTSTPVAAPAPAAVSPSKPSGSAKQAGFESATPSIARPAAGASASDGASAPAVAVVASAGGAAVSADAVLDDLGVAYRIAVDVGWGTGTVDCSEEVQVVNRSAFPLSNLNLSVLPRATGQFTLTAPPTIAGGGLHWTWSTPVNLHLVFDTPVAPRSAITVGLAFRLGVDHARGTIATRMGRTAGILNLGNAFATVSRAHGWYAVGDPVVSRSAET
jgi:hypothetical protein